MTTQLPQTATARRRSQAGSGCRKRALPYLLSLPALLVCIGILIPFFTAVYYSLHALPAEPAADEGLHLVRQLHQLPHRSRRSGTRSTISLLYAGLTVGLELLLGLGIALLLQKPTRFNNIVSILLLLPLMTAPALAALMWKLMTNPNFGILSYLVSLLGFTDFSWASDPVDGAVHRRAGRHLGLHALHHDPAAGRPALAAASSPSRRRRSTACRAASSSSASRCRC